MMLIITCVRGVRRKFDKIGAVGCILSVPKLVIINLKINIFWGVGGVIAHRSKRYVNKNWRLYVF